MGYTLNHFLQSLDLIWLESTLMRVAAVLLCLTVPVGGNALFGAVKNRVGSVIIPAFQKRFHTPDSGAPYQK